MTAHPLRGAWFARRPNLEGWWGDVRMGARSLLHARTFSIVAILTLALGIGANAAIFAVVNAVLVRPLPYPQGSRLVRLWETRSPAGNTGPTARPQRSPRVTVAEIQALRPVLSTLTHLSFVGGPALMTVTGAGPARRMQDVVVAPSYFDTLGVSARLGRTFGEGEEAPGMDGVLIHSFARLSSVKPGFTAVDVMTFQVALPPDRYPLPRLKAFADDVVARLQRVPGVEAAAHGQPPMVALRDSFGFSRRAGEPRRPGPDVPVVRLMSAAYPTTMGIAVTRGRGFAAEDNGQSGRVLLVNETLAARVFPGEDPTGAQVFIGPDDKPWEVIGIVADVRQHSFDQAPTPQVFALSSQWPGDNVFPLGPYFAVRSRGDRADLLTRVRSIATSLDPEAGLFNVASLDSMVSNRISQPRLYAVLLGTFAGLAGVLACVGIYGVMAYAVGQRTRETGIRMALGAAPSRVLRMVMGQSLSLATAGILVGLAAALALSRLFRGLLFAIDPLDVATYVGVTLLFILVVALAAWLPSRRATRVVPVAALRAE